MAAADLRAGLLRGERPVRQVRVGVLGAAAWRRQRSGAVHARATAQPHPRSTRSATVPHHRPRPPPDDAVPVLSASGSRGGAARRLSCHVAAAVAHLRAPAEGQPDTRIPMLLLLDETRLLSANLPEFLAVGRGFKAGVVTCYQELDQIRDESTRREILTNSNTLIALRGMGPGSRKSIAERLARATVQVAGVGSSVGEEARQQANVNVSRQEVAVLGEYEMRAMPGPKHVALVHIQDGTVPDAKPFLVDLTNNGAASAVGAPVAA